jgi:endonuclease YncB( thermonuclease family)
MNLRIGFATIAAVVLSAVLHGQAPTPGSGAVIVDAPVRVVAPDALEVQIDGRRVGVRIAGIVVPSGKSRCGAQAMAMLRELVTDGVVLYEDPAIPPFDARNLRTYRVITLAGQSVAEHLAAAGYASEDPNVPAALEWPVIVGAAAAAKAAGRRCLR